MSDDLHTEDLIDPYGESILQELEPAHRFSRWMFETIEPFLGERILEIGSGIGNISRQLPIREELALSDYSPEYRRRLQETYADRQNVRVLELDLTSDESFKDIQGRFDSIICLNVLEHIEDDCGALTRMRDALSPAGKLIILVPQYQALMSKMDRLLGHYRRYSHRELTSKFEETGLNPVTMMNFNSLGALGWLVSNTLMGSTSFGSGKIKLFDATVPFFKTVEKFLPMPGLSLIGVASKEL